jgi:hypothetical protein
MRETTGYVSSSGGTRQERWTRSKQHRSIRSKSEANVSPADTTHPTVQTCTLFIRLSNNLPYLLAECVQFNGLVNDLACAQLERAPQVIRILMKN